MLIRIHKFINDIKQIEVGNLCSPYFSFWSNVSIFFNNYEEIIGEKKIKGSVLIEFG